jgi:hypothetical protein
MNKKYLFRGVSVIGLIVLLFFSLFLVFTNGGFVAADASPVINSVSPISAAQRQTIVIRGSGFGNVQPEVTSLDDGSVVTLVGGSTPVIRIYDVDGWDSWEAGCEDSQWVPGGLIGVYLTSWSDTEIVLGGFGTDLNVNGQAPRNIKVGDPLIVNVQTANGQAAYATTVVSSESDAAPNSAGAPVISSVSPISATRLQTIVIRGSGFGNVQPEFLDFGDGSVDTVGGGDTPALRIYNQDGLKSWQAGVQDNPSSGADSISIILVNWSDTEIVLGGFGTALKTDGEGPWNLSPGDQLLISVLTTNGQAVYTATVGSGVGSGEPEPALTPTPTLTVSCKSYTASSNFRVEISGSLTYNGTGLQGLPVLFSYSVDEGKSWNQLTLVSTDGNGDFLAVWLPYVTGNFLLKAEYPGDDNYSETSTVVNFAVSPFGEQNVFSVTSNSTISALAFNATSGELGFTVSGPTDTTGYVNVYVPKALISDASNLKVLLDGNAISFNTESLADSWFISFTYPHSTHEVTLEMNGVPSTILSENQLEQWLPYGIVIVLTVLIAFLLISIKKEKTNIQLLKREKT